jgi:hypothetical protein
MKKGLKITLITIGSILVLAILVLGYLGFVPGVSAIFGSNKPVNLGVKATAADLESANQKTGVQIIKFSEQVAVEQSNTYEGQKELTAQFTPQETSAMINNGKWKYSVITDSQVKVNDDGTVEFSAMVNLKNLPYAQRARHMTEYQELMDKAKQKLNLLPGKVPVYVKGKLSVTNNQVDIDAEKVRIGKISIDPEMVSKEEVNSFVETRLTKVPGLNVKSLTFENGKMNFDGTVPEIERRQAAD